MKIVCQNKKYLLDSVWLKVRQDELLVDGNKTIDDYYVTENPDVALVVAITKNNEVILKTEYRYAADQVLTEIPGGSFRLAEELPLDSAKRELKEETGYESDQWELLAKTYDNPPRETSTVFLYLARNCILTSEQQLDEFEYISLRLVTFQEAINMVLSNEICVNSSASALMRCAMMYPELLTKGAEGLGPKNIK